MMFKSENVIRDPGVAFDSQLMTADSPEFQSAALALSARGEDAISRRMREQGFDRCFGLGGVMKVDAESVSIPQSRTDRI
jgi:hypothetical protein